MNNIGNRWKAALASYQPPSQQQTNSWHVIFFASDDGMVFDAIRVAAAAVSVILAMPHFSVGREYFSLPFILVLIYKMLHIKSIEQQFIFYFTPISHPFRASLTVPMFASVHRMRTNYIAYSSRFLVRLRSSVCYCHFAKVHIIEAGISRRQRSCMP